MTTIPQSSSQSMALLDGRRSMKAIIRTGYLTPTFQFSEIEPLPTFSPSTHKDQVLIAVKAAAVNPIDYKLKPILKIAHRVVGFDVSGVIVQVGDNVASLKPGDEVFGMASEGSLSEFAIAKESCVAKKPDFLSFAEAAALPVAYVVAYQSLKSFANVGSNSAVLIIGASGGCGISSLQLAKALNAPRIVAVCSGKNADFVKENGATEVVDYTQSKMIHSFWSSNKGKFDFVFDAATGGSKEADYTANAMTILKDDGKYTQLSGKSSTWMKKMLHILPENRSLPLVSNTMNTSDLNHVALLLRETGTKPVILLQSFDGSGVHEGFKMLKSGRTKGKIVYEIAQS